MKVSIEHNQSRFEYNFYLWNEFPAKGSIISYKPVKLESFEIEAGKYYEVMKPTIIMPRPEFKEFMQCMVNEAAKMGILPKDHEEITETLEATRTHLRDMRRLVFDLMKKTATVENSDVVENEK